jgi:hypothetical protein
VRSGTCQLVAFGNRVRTWAGTRTDRAHVADRIRRWCRGWRNASLGFTNEEPVLLADGGGADGVFAKVIIDLDASTPPPINLRSSAVGPEACDLESILATGDLERRNNRASDAKAESQAEMELTLELARSPRDFFQKLVDMVLKLSLADSAGISLLDEKSGQFIWPAVAGGLSPHLGGGTPRSFGPCGTVLDRNTPLLFVQPERHFTYLRPITPPLEEVLLIPFHVGGKPVGTI